MPVYIFMLPSKGEKQTASLWIIFAWWAGSLVAASATRMYYDHYFLQMLPPASIMLAIIVGNLIKTVLRKSTKLTSRVILTALLLFVAIDLSLRCLTGFSNSIDVLNEWNKKNTQWLDTESKLALSMKKEMAKGDYIFVVNGEIILYHLTGAEMPSRFVFPLFFRSKHFSRVAGIDPDEEISRILQRNPKFRFFRNLRTLHD